MSRGLLLCLFCSVAVQQAWGNVRSLSGYGTCPNGFGYSESSEAAAAGTLCRMPCTTTLRCCEQNHVNSSSWVVEDTTPHHGSSPSRSRPICTIP
jgi:hypothetical protein